jgi:prolyl 4-hydroxylase
MSGSPSLEDLQSRALGGEPQAQVDLARAFDQQGEAEQAASWLTAAAAGGNTEAVALLGVWELLAHNVERNHDRGLARLTDAAKRGDEAACCFMATLHAAGFAASADWRLAGEWLIAAAKLGNDRALVQLALLSNDSETELRVRLLYAAAVGGSAIAPYFLGLSSLAVPGASTQQAGQVWLAIAAARGNPCAARFTQPLSAVPPLAAGPELTPSFWERVAAAFAPERFLGRAQAVVQVPDPPIMTATGLLPPALCDYLVGLAAPLMQRAEVNDVSEGTRVHQMRTNSQTCFGITNTDVIGILAARRVAELAGEPFENQEDTMILRYRPGEAYEDHFDFVDPRVPAFAHELATRGQRIATVLIYLNDDYSGGDTDFPRLGWRVRGARGDALAFRSVTVNGEPDLRTLHAGLPPRDGEKWVLSKWIRDRPQLGRNFLQSQPPR